MPAFFIVRAPNYSTRAWPENSRQPPNQNMFIIWQKAASRIRSRVSSLKRTKIDYDKNH